jgi:transcriptional regulator with XRE-family HTH domain
MNYSFSPMQHGIDQALLTAFGKHLAHMRKEKGLTQEKLAEKASLDTAQLGKIEIGLTNLTINTIHRLAKGLGISLKELMDFKIK